MTHLLLSALQGTVREAADPKGYIYVASLYTYLQKQMPQERLPDLVVNFHETCSIAYFSDRFRLEALQIERDNLGTQISKLSDQLSEVHSIITDPNFFVKLAAPNPQNLRNTLITGS